ncbi:Uncharacterised protein [uncultured archaeon]|nr:Uncharacterised protein [uncultured archaeon]
MVISVSDIPTVLVIAGIIFIFVALARISGKITIDTDEIKAKILGVAGVILLGLGLIATSTGIFLPPEIKPPPITGSVSTPTPTSTSIPPDIKITNPKEREEVPDSINVSGTISGELPEGQFMWVFVNPQEIPSLWWPQGVRIEPRQGQWNMHVWVGNTTSNIDIVIAVVLVDKKDDQYLWDYGRSGDLTKNYPGIRLPDSAKVIDKVTVTKI